MFLVRFIKITEYLVWIKHKFHPCIEVKCVFVLPGDNLKVFETFLILSLIDSSSKLILGKGFDLFSTKEFKVFMDLL